MSRYRATLEGDAITTDNRELEAENEAQQVYLWDIGPEKPIQPKRPEGPKGKEGEPAFELAMVEFREQIELYAISIKDYAQRTREYERFQRDHGGPIELQRWSVDAQDALANDEATVTGKNPATRERCPVTQKKPRYYISSRTRGHAKLPNFGLPEGMKPGRGHAENLRREEEANEEFQKVLKSDPVFGEVTHP